MSFPCLTIGPCDGSHFICKMGTTCKSICVFSKLPENNSKVPGLSVPQTTNDKNERKKIFALQRQLKNNNNNSAF